MAEAPIGLVNPNDFANCTLTTCNILTSYYNYRINLAPNAIFLSIFSLLIFIYLGIWIVTKRCHFFTLVMELGLIFELIGYSGRIVSYENQWNQSGFLIQIVCLTIGPAFFAAGIYICLGRIVIVYGPENSRLPAAWYTRSVS